MGESLGPIPAASLDRRSADMPPGWAAVWRSLLRMLDGAYLRWVDRRLKQRDND